MRRDPDSFKIFLVILGIIVLCFFIFPRNNYEKKYEELYDQYLELESKLEETESKLEETESKYEETESKYEECEIRLDSIYTDISVALDSIYTVFDYFEYEEVSFDEAHNAFDKVFNALCKYS